MALKAHLRSPDQPKTKIDVDYGDAKGNLAVAAQVLRSIGLLETVSEHTAEAFAWPAPFTLELQTCGFLTLGPFDPPDRASCQSGRPS